MIDNYPVSSYDFNDRILTSYEYLTYLLGVQTDPVTVVSGLYDNIDQSGLAFMSSTTGIPNAVPISAQYQLGFSSSATFVGVVPYLLKDYVDRKYLGAI